MPAFGSALPIGVPVAHCVVARVFLVLLVHLKADLFNAALLCLVLVTAVLTGRLIWGVRKSLSAVPLQFCGFSDGRQEPGARMGENVCKDRRQEVLCCDTVERIVDVLLK